MNSINLVELAKAHGQENLRFHVHLRQLRVFVTLGIAFTTDSDNFDLVECVVDSEGRYPRIVGENGFGYKISLKPLVEGYERRDYYVSDLERIVSSNDGARVAFLQTDVH